MASLTTGELEDFRDERSRTTSSKRWRIEVVTLRQLLNFAVARGHIPFSPMHSVFLPIWNGRVDASVPRVLRPGVARVQSLGAGRLSAVERLEVAEIEAELHAEGNWSARPRTRAECPPAGAPCPWQGCRHHLAVEVDGEFIKVVFPGRGVDEILESCSLRIADAGNSMNCNEVSKFMNLTRERVAQIEKVALRKYFAAMPADLHPA